MRLKIKYSSTKKFVLNFNGKTLGELTEAVKAFVADTYGETRPEFALSLNGQVALAGFPDTALSELGIVASDMLTVLPGVVAGGSATGGASSGRIGSDVDAGGGDRGGESSQPQQPSGGGAKSGSTVAMLPVVLVPTTLLEVSDSTKGQDSVGQTLPTSLQTLLANCRPKDAGQVVNLLAHITMLECDFKAINSSSHSTSPAPSQACSCPSSSCTGPCISPAPNPGWDGTVASLNYEHKSFSSFTCSLVLVSMGEMKQMLISFPGQDVEISTKVNVRDYFADDKSSPIEGSSLRNVSRLAKHLRNELLVPLQLAAHRILDVPSPRHLAGLPPELLFQVLKRLDARSVLRLACCCKRLQSAATDDAVWMLLYKRDFGDFSPTLDGDFARESLGGLSCWLARYKKRYLEQKARNLGWQDPRHQIDIDMQSNMIPLPHPRIYPIGPMFPNHPRGPQPVGPYPVIPDPTTPFNPYGDPDSPYYGGELPNAPPQYYQPQNPLGPLHRRDPLNPLGDPLNPFGDPTFGGLGPGLPGRRNQPWGGPVGGPGFRFI